MRPEFMPAARVAYTAPCQRESIAPDRNEAGDCPYWHFPPIDPNLSPAEMLAQAIERLESEYTRFARDNVMSTSSSVADLAHLGIQAIKMLREARSAISS